jgi:NitT/TauT family transport system substrate-binding protein
MSTAITGSAARGATIAAMAVGLSLAAHGTYAAETVSVRLSFTPFAAHIPIYVARDKGFYRDAGLDVQILTGRGSSFAALTVGSGKEEFGIADSAAVVTTRAQGVPIVALSNLQQDNGVALFATEASGISGPAGLKGRNVGVFTGSTTTIFLQALLKKNGLSMDDIKPVTVRSGTDLPLVLSGRIDAEVSVYNNELVAWRIEHPELKLRHWTMASLGFDTPGYAVVTNESLFKQKPRIAKAFNEATAKGIDYAVKNPAEAVTIITKAVPELKTEIETAKWQATIPTTRSPVTEKDGPGALDRRKWEALNDLLLAYDVIKAKVNLDDLLKSTGR